MRVGVRDKAVMKNWHDVVSYVDMLRIWVDDVDPLPADMTAVHRDGMDGAEEWDNGSRALLTIMLLMVMASIDTRDCGWLSNKEIWRWLRALEKAPDLDGQICAEICVRALALFEEEIEAARRRDEDFMKEPFHEGGDAVGEDWIRHVGELCGRTGCASLMDAYSVATAGELTAEQGDSEGLVGEIGKLWMGRNDDNGHDDEVCSEGHMIVHR